MEISFPFMLRSVWKQQLQALSHNTASVDSSEDIQFGERCHYVINCFGALLNERVPDVSEIKSGSQKHRRGNASLCHVDNVGLFFSHSSTLGTIFFPVKQVIFPTKKRFCGTLEIPMVFRLCERNSRDSSVNSPLVQGRRLPGQSAHHKRQHCALQHALKKNKVFVKRYLSWGSVECIEQRGQDTRGQDDDCAHLNHNFH